MVRLATVTDAEQLNLLNKEFNGPGETTLVHIRASLCDNKQEVVIVDEEDGALVGFVCVQLKKSFCYEVVTAELTEVYVKPAYRKKGIASRMIFFAEEYCRNHFPVYKFELLTGRKNKVAQAVYGKLGYADDGELHMSKKVK